MSNRFRVPDAEGVLALHASAVVVEAGVILFLGPSETGKTTVARMLLQDADILAEDAVWIVSSACNKQWMVIDATGKTLTNPLSTEQVRGMNGPFLHCVVRLFRSEVPVLEELHDLETCHFLSKAFFELKRNMYLSPAARHKCFKKLAQVAISTMGFRLNFDRSSTTLNLLRESLTEV